MSLQGYNAQVNTDIFDGLFVSFGGMKVGRGVPFPENVARKQVLESVLSAKTWAAPVKRSIMSCLRQVQYHIDREIESDIISSW
jgi:hypothetical protein